MMLQLDDDGVVSKVDEEDLIYVDKKELDEFIEEYNHLKKENEQLKEFKEQSEIKVTEKQSHIIHLESKIHRMREQIKKLEYLYHYRRQKGSVDLKKECWKLKQENEQLKTFREQHIDEYIKLKKVCNGYKKENEQLKNENAKMKKELSLLAEFNQKAML